MNYTIFTSKCKGPQYAPDLCCSALKEFACPYTNEINDLTNDCASTMFSYISLYGKYPPGLFSSECREGKSGLNCSAYISKSDNSTSVSAACTSHTFLPLIAYALVFLMGALLL
ncbi:GPI-anchored protein LORELEI [Platanthera guangdongensis]|uniref:GPI-anchored protein LORELEI n=1 Tax=Platanthera guangdongensis TaxID=2320717 RepID=A0ABR2MZN5_9ASPA